MYEKSLIDALYHFFNLARKRKCEIKRLKRELENRRPKQVAPHVFQFDEGVFAWMDEMGANWGGVATSLAQAQEDMAKYEQEALLGVGRKV